MRVLPVQAVRRPEYAAALLIAAAGAIVIAVQWAGGRMLWLDEEMIAINLRDRTLGQLAAPLSLGQAAPYGWLVLERFMLVLFGTSERVLRFVPMAFGVGTLAAAVWIGRRFMTAVGAAALAFLCAAGQWLSFHALELKHYSADAFWGLLLPALAAWALEPGASPTVSRRRVVAWWIVATIAQWTGNGAIFVAPACALVLVGVAGRRGGRRAALLAALPGLAWLASFAGNYRVALAPALANDFLRRYWSNAFPPPGAALAGRLAWIARQLAPLADKPGGTAWPLSFWSVAAIGFATAPGYARSFRLLFGLVPISAFVWAAIGLVPLMDRLALWIVPSIYVGIAMAVEAAASLLMDGWRHRRWAAAAARAAPVGGRVVLGTDINSRGTIYLNLGRQIANHELDDRGAITWLTRQQRDGDVWVTTHDALPALWWYAAPIAAPVLDAVLVSDSAACRADELGAWLDAHAARRVLIYLGFGHNVSDGFDDVLLARLGSRGMVTAYRPFGSLGHAIVIDLRQPSSNVPTIASLSRRPDAPGPRVRSGCIAVEPARRW